MKGNFDFGSGKPGEIIQEEFRMIEEMMQFESRMNQSKFQKLLHDIKSKDEMLIMEATQNLSVELSMLQNINNINFNLDQFVHPLIETLKYEGIPDIPVYAITSLNHIIDLHPQSSFRLTDPKSIEAILSIFLSDSLFDAFDQTISLLTKISIVGGTSLLNSPSFSLVFAFQDFFTFSTHKNLITTMINVVMAIKSEADYEGHLASIDQSFVEYHIQNSEKHELIFEFVSSLVTKMFRIYQKNPKKKRDLIEKLLGGSGTPESQLIVQNEAMEHLRKFTHLAPASEWETVEFILPLLGLGSAASFEVYQSLMRKGVVREALKFLEILLKNEVEGDKLKPFAIEVVSFINGFFTFREKPIPLVADVAGLLNISINVNEDPANKDKFKLIMQNEPECRPLFKLFLSSVRIICEKNKELIYKYVTIWAYEKMIGLINQERDVCDYVSPYTIAETTSYYLQSDDIMVVTLGLFCLSSCIERKSFDLIQAFFREGVVERLEELESHAGVDRLKAIMSEKKGVGPPQMPPPPFGGGFNSKEKEKEMEEGEFFTKELIEDESKFLSIAKLVEEMKQNGEIGEDEPINQMLEELEKLKKIQSQLMSKESQEAENKEKKPVEAEETAKLSGETATRSKICELAKEIKEKLEILTSEMKIKEIMAMEQTELEEISKKIRSGDFEAIQNLKNFTEKRNGLSISQIRSSSLIDSLLFLVKNGTPKEKWEKTERLLTFLNSIQIVLTTSQNGQQVKTLGNYLLNKIVLFLNDDSVLNFSENPEIVESGLCSSDARVANELKLIGMPAQVQVAFKKKNEVETLRKKMKQELDEKASGLSEGEKEQFLNETERKIKEKHLVFGSLRPFIVQADRSASLKRIQKFLLKNIQRQEQIAPNFDPKSIVNDVRMVGFTPQTLPGGEEDNEENHPEPEENLEDGNEEESEEKRAEITKNLASMEENMQKFTASMKTLMHHEKETKEETKPNTQNPNPQASPLSNEKKTPSFSETQMEEEKKEEEPGSKVQKEEPIQGNSDPNPRDPSMNPKGENLAGKSAPPEENYGCLQIRFTLDNEPLDPKMLIHDLVGAPLTGSNPYGGTKRVLLEFEFDFKLTRDILKKVPRASKKRPPEIIQKEEELWRKLDALNSQRVSGLKSIKSLSSFNSSCLEFMGHLKNFELAHKSREKSRVFDTKEVSQPERIVNNIKFILNVKHSSTCFSELRMKGA